MPPTSTQVTVVCAWAVLFVVFGSGGVPGFKLTLVVPVPAAVKWPVTLSVALFRAPRLSTLQL